MVLKENQFESLCANTILFSENQWKNTNYLNV